jgi:hypothetical protein
MAAPAIVRGSYLDIAMGNGAAPEVFSIICGLNTRNFTQQVNTSDSFVADCADPEDVPIRRLVPTGKQWSLSGEGRYNRSQRSVIDAAVGIPKSFRFIMSEPTADNIADGWYHGTGMITNVQFGGSGAESGNFATFSLQIESDGEWVWVDAS